MDVHVSEYFYQPLKMYVAPHRRHLLDNATLLLPALLYLTSLYLLVFLSLYVYIFTISLFFFLYLYFLIMSVYCDITILEGAVMCPVSPQESMIFF